MAPKEEALSKHPHQSEDTSAEPSDVAIGEVVHDAEVLQRHLTPRQVQFFAIGGAIGTALFVTIGYGLLHGGAGSLLIAFILQSRIVALINSCLAEMTIFMPVSAAFIQHADVWVDKAWGFMAGWNFFIFEALLIPFEITAFDLILTFWSDEIPSAAIITACIVLYGLTNVLAVKYFGEAEFWLAIGKIFLVVLLFSFTFVTMCGGNPQRHAYGFSNWTKPHPFLEHLSTGDLGRFQGFLSALWQAAFIVVGPEYIATCAGETQNPRKTLRSAFKQVYWRFGVFFVGGALCVGIIIPADDASLVSTFSAGHTGTGASSPFVMAMRNMKVEVLPHIVNALLLTSVYSAGNCYVYTTCRSLHSLASSGHAPEIFTRTTKNGVPFNALLVALAFACLSYLKLNSGSMKVLTWLTNLITGGQIVTYIVIALNYIFFHRALTAQRLDRAALPYRGWLQPYAAWVALVWMVLVELFYGHAVFLDGNWDIGSFFSSYTMAFLACCTFTGWKVCRRTRFVRPAEADLVWARPAVERHEAQFAEMRPGGGGAGWRGLWGLRRRGAADKSDA
ncbi:putative general amino acid permease [Macrophomina phaseolina]|uniref:General amino acid permease n=1 Tax=Macrophomina phaseolina TaxID=35725 RepID=A0ABQ8GFH9_9PEZI|nr:putative general amino acid permease [Macrophomina phaseolina]